MPNALIAVRANKQKTGKCFKRSENKFFTGVYKALTYSCGSRRPGARDELYVYPQKTLQGTNQLLYQLNTCPCTTRKWKLKQTFKLPWVYFLTTNEETCKEIRKNDPPTQRKQLKHTSLEKSQLLDILDKYLN